MNCTITLRAWSNRFYERNKPTNVTEMEDGSLRAEINHHIIIYPLKLVFEGMQTRPTDKELSEACIICDKCSKKIDHPNAFYTCTVCEDQDLCAECYENLVQNRKHRFDRVIWV